MAKNGKIIVCKFGGSSAADAEKFRVIKNVVLSNCKRKIIVVSAPGKRFDGDEKVTDLLVEAAAERREEERKKILRKVKERFYDFTALFGENTDKERVKREIDCALDGSEGETLVSRGEFLSAKILAEFLGFDFADAKNLVKIRNERIDEEGCLRAAREVKIGRGLVVPGFYGENERGEIKLLPRGGSDLTGAILSFSFGTETYENFTDVDGVFDANPKEAGKPRLVKKISYAQLRKFSQCGAKVMSAEACGFLRRSSVKTIIKKDDEGKCTVVSAETRYKGKFFASIAAVKVVIKKCDGISDGEFFAEVFGAAKNIGLKIFSFFSKNDDLTIYFSHDCPRKIFEFSDCAKKRGFGVFACENVCLFNLFCNKKIAREFILKAGGKIIDYDFSDGTLTFSAREPEKKYFYGAFGRINEGRERR